MLLRESVFAKKLNTSFYMVKPGMFQSSTKSQKLGPGSNVIGENDSATHKTDPFYDVTCTI
jgi:hypothetical protein